MLLNVFWGGSERRTRFSMLSLRFLGELLGALGKAVNAVVGHRIAEFISDVAGYPREAALRSQ